MDLCIKCEDNDVKDMYVNHGFFYKGDSGIDIFFKEKQTIPKGSTVLIDLGIACEMKEKNTVFNFGKVELFVNKSYFLMPRSSIYKTPLRLSNSVGLIDSCYRGNLKVALDNFSDKDYTVHKGERLFQIVSGNLEPFNIILTDKLSETRRGQSGFGSSNNLSNSSSSGNSSITPITIPAGKLDNGVIQEHNLW
jgi:dUTP pyrophosphatase